jgi:spore coat polysaccharide biosynthesis protein SpsF
MGSSRLPGKPLRDVGGMSALERVAGRAAAARVVEKVVIATTTLTRDDELADFAAARGFGVFRGSEIDVLRRLAEAAVQFQFDVVVEVDGDDLLCATEYMDRGVALLEAEGADLVHYEGLPLGATPNILRTAALTRAVALKTHEDTETGFFKFLVDSGQFKILRPRVEEPAHLHDRVRMTLDYPEDLAFFSAVYQALDAQPGWSFADMVALLRTRPELVEMNQGLDEAYRAHFEAGLKRQEQ